MTLRNAVVRGLFETDGIETRNPAKLQDLGLAAPGRRDYAPSGWLTLRRTLRAGDVSEADVFLDLGSGKGRVLLEALRYPFARVIGVEISKELHEAAVENERLFRGPRRCRRIELILADAVEYPIPDDVSIVYLANPFTGEIFSQVIVNLLASLERSPRPVRVIYTNPREEQVLFDAGATLLKTIPGLRPTPRWSRSNATHVYLFGGRSLPSTV